MTTLRLPDHVHTQADVEQLWRALMGPLGFSRHTLWLAFVEADGTPVPGLTQIDDIPSRPAPGTLDTLIGICAELMTGMPPLSRIALLRSRPGSGLVGPDDRAWAEAIATSARAAGVRCEPVHLATDERIVVVATDDLC